MSNDDARVVLDAAHLFEPGMRSNITRLETLGRVRAQDLRDKVTAVVSHELWNGVVGAQDLFVEVVGLWVFERQVATDHGI